MYLYHQKTTSTPFTSYTLTQSTADNNADNNNAHDDKNMFPMTTPQPATLLPTATVPTHNNSPITEPDMHHPKKQAANKAATTINDDDNFPMMMLMTMMPMTCSPQPLPPTHDTNPSPKSVMKPHKNSFHDLTTHWLRAYFDPVFQTTEHLAAAIANLSNSILKTSFKNASTPDPTSQKPNINQQSNCPQPPRYRPHKLTSFLYPLLPTCHPNHSYTTVLDHPSISMYCRYMAHDFRPP